MTRTLFRTTRRVVYVAFACFAFGAMADDFDEEVSKATLAFGELEKQCDMLVLDGRIDQATRLYLVKFPEEKRTAAEACALGDFFFRLDPKLSYQLHREAVQKKPVSAHVQLFWAIEQQRAGEYVGALAAYDAFSKATPNFAPAHGLAADCLIRLGQTKEAVARWQLSEASGKGTLEEFEEFVCLVYHDPALRQKRAALQRKAATGDVEAAIQLVALDGKFELDWWNAGPILEYLQHDLPMLEKLPASPRVKAAQCVAECVLKVGHPSSIRTDAERGAAAKDLRAILERHGFVLDAAKTLPPDPPLTYLLLSLAVDHIMTVEELRERFGKVLRDEGLARKSAPLLEIAAAIKAAGEGEAHAELEKAAWEATGDPQFASGYLGARLNGEKLKPDDPFLLEMLGKFPEDRRILSVAIDAHEKPPAELLIQGIKAEYRRLSVTGGPASPTRARAANLRRYFAQLGELLK